MKKLGPLIERVINYKNTTYYKQRNLRLFTDMQSN